MSDIGEKLLALLRDVPGEWGYVAACDGLRHGPTGVLLTPAVADCVLLTAAGELRPVLTEDDQRAIYAALAPLVARHREAAGQQHEATVRDVLGLK